MLAGQRGDKQNAVLQSLRQTEKNFVHQQILNSLFFFPETLIFGMSDTPPVLVNFMKS